MRVAVTDTNVFIDLFRADLLTPLLQSGVAVHTTREAINELDRSHQSILLGLANENKITVKRFSPTDIVAISQLQLSAGLSFVDRGIFHYAKSIKNCLLLSNTPILHGACSNSQIETYSTIGLLSLFNKTGSFPNTIVCRALTLIRSGIHTQSVREREALSLLCECNL